jgi:hypothetical protein
MGTKKATIWIAAVSTLAVTCIASAAIPDSGGVIHGCYASKDGSLRVVDTGASGACDTKKETALDWNQTGPTGATGPQGPAGPPGTSHGYYTYAGLLASATLGGSFVKVGELKGLAPGTYIVSARGLVEDLPNN